MVFPDMALEESMSRRIFRVPLGLVVLAFSLLAQACGATSAPASTDPYAGTITISGAWALYPLMVRWGEEYQNLHPQVRFDISAGGAGKGMADALSGAVDIGMVSREIYPEEHEKGAFWVSVSRDAVFPTVNAENPVWTDLRQNGVARQTFIGIYITGQISTWGQVVGRPEVMDPIHVFTRSDAAGAPATWAKYLGYEQEDLSGTGVYGDPGVLEAVVRDPLGIGFNNLNYIFDFETGRPAAGALVLPIDIDGDGLADPEEIYETKEQAVEAVAMGRYPSPPARDLNLVTLGKPSGLVKAFLKWVLTDGQAYVGEVGYIPLSEEELDEGLAELE
jgi:phosphate transport system substrate-binding protein